MLRNTTKTVNTAKNGHGPPTFPRSPATPLTPQRAWFDLNAASGHPQHAPRARSIAFSLTMNFLTSSTCPQLYAATKRSQPAPHVCIRQHSYSTLTRHSFTLLSPVLHGLHPSGATLLVECANSMTRAHATTQHNSASPSQPSPETYRHCTPRSRQH